MAKATYDPADEAVEQQRRAKGVPQTGPYKAAPVTAAPANAMDRQPAKVDVMGPPKNAIQLATRDPADMMAEERRLFSPGAGNPDASIRAQVAAAPTPGAPRTIAEFRAGAPGPADRPYGPGKSLPELEAGMAKPTPAPAQPYGPEMPGGVAADRAMGFTGRTAPADRLRQLTRAREGVIQQMAALPKQFQTGPMSPQDRAAWEAQRTDLAMERDRLESEIRNLSGAMNPGNMVTPEQWAASKNALPGMIAREQQRRGSGPFDPQAGPVPTADVMTEAYREQLNGGRMVQANEAHDDRHYMQGRARQKDAYETSRAYAASDEARRMRSEDFADEMVRERQRGAMASARADTAAQDARAARATADSTANSPDLIRRQIEGRLQDQETQNRLAALDQKYRVREAETRDRFQNASLDEKQVLADPIFNDRLSEAATMFQAIAGDVLGGGEDNARNLDAYERAVSELERIVQSMPPGGRDIAQRAIFNKLRATPTTGRFSRELETLLRQYGSLVTLGGLDLLGEGAIASAGPTARGNAITSRLRRLAEGDQRPASP